MKTTKRSDRTTASAAILPEHAPARHDGAEEDSSDRPEQAFLVVYGTDELASRVVPLRDGVEVIFGRSANATVTIDDDQVSRTHLRVIRYGADIVVTDAGSRNGTLINGTAITGSTRVSSGDELTVGPVSVIVGITSRTQRQMLVASAVDFEERLAAEIDRSIRFRRSLGVAMLRVHGAPGETRRAVDRIAHGLRRMDLLAQYGPEEYAIILPELDREATEAAAQRIASDARRSADHRQASTGPRASTPAVHIGLAVCPQDGCEVGVVVSRARSALRRARVEPSSHGVAAPPAEPALTDADVVVADPLMKRVYFLARKVAPAPTTALVLGETGVGKEIIARAIHRASPRATQRFVALNCSALPETLLESELFGHERGAFTGAEARKVGYFEAAAGGTLFLDEIGEMPQGVQAKLLRVMEQRVISRVGGTDTVPVDTRVLCATHRDLEAEIRAGRFREDLFFRISAFTIVVPPLRDRRSEIRPLAVHFAQQFARELRQPTPSFSEEALAALEAYRWPGNVRELRNAIERAVVLMPGGLLDRDHLPDRVLGRGTTSTPTLSEPSNEPTGVKQRMAEVEREAVEAALAANGGNQTRAARQLGVSRFAFIRLMEKYGMKRPRGKGR